MTSHWHLSCQNLAPVPCTYFFNAQKLLLPPSLHFRSCLCAAEVSHTCFALLLTSWSCELLNHVVLKKISTTFLTCNTSPIITTRASSQIFPNIGTSLGSIMSYRTVHILHCVFSSKKNLAAEAQAQVWVKAMLLTSWSCSPYSYQS